MIENLVKIAKMVVKCGLILTLGVYISFSGSAMSQKELQVRAGIWMPEIHRHGLGNELPVRSNRFELKSECLRELNAHVNSELYASMVYMNMGAHFDSHKVARKGFAKFFRDQSHEEKDHAHKLQDYINKRGGIVSLLDVKMPLKNTWSNPRQALEDAIQLENEVNDYIHKIHGIAEHTCLDPHLMDFLESEYMEEQVDSINQLTRLHSILSQMQGGVGEYLLDRQLLSGQIEAKDL